MDGFAGTKFNGLSSHPDLLSLEACQVHFNAMPFAVVERVMFERRKLKRATKFTVDPGQKIEIEVRGDALSVVVGRVEYVGGLDEISADNKATAGPKNVCRIAKKGRGLVW